jgi:hypothetical protein
MRRSRHSDIRKALKEHPDGLTRKQLQFYTKLTPDCIKQALPKMPDVYIDRWEKQRYGRDWTPVYIAINVPENCPKPDINLLKN